MLSDEDRIAIAARCRDCAPVPKVPDAGKVLTEADGTRVQIMHNGLKVVADGYYGGWMTRLISLCRGHHEPQEERLFHELVGRLDPAATMIELGGFWAYYSLWFLHGWPARRAVVVEPDPAHLATGKANAALNRLDPEFLLGYAGPAPMPPAPFRTEESGTIPLPCFAVPQLMADRGIDVLDLLHLDIQGAEVEVLRSCTELFRQQRIRWVFASTHGHHITGDPLTHQRCLDLLRSQGAVIEAEHDVYESFSGDGLIVARFALAPAAWKPVELSRNRYSESLCRNPLYDLAEKLAAADPDRGEQAVAALYRAILLRPPDPGGLAHFAEMLRATKDIGAVIDVLAGGEEFARNVWAFLARYFGVAGAFHAALQNTPGPGPLICSGFQFTLGWDGPLGKRGDQLLIPSDRVVMPSIVAHGSYAPETMDFAAERLQPRESYTVLDIGANLGMFSRQLLVRSDAIEHCICIEPDPGNFRALAFNLAGFPQVRAYNVALGASDGEARFFRDRENSGNYSLNTDAMRARPHHETTVTVVAADRWLRETVPAGTPIVWKSDTQGYDEVIICQTPPEVWSRVHCAVIELWRIRKPSFDIDLLSARIDRFANKSLGLERSVTVDEILEYLRGDDWSHTDLYLW